MKASTFLMGIMTIILTIVILFGVGLLQVEFGRCTNSETKDGKLYNGEPFYNYISYRCIDSVSENDIVMTISINDIDNECIERFDTVLFRSM